MEPVAPSTTLARAEALRRKGFSDPAELDDLLDAVSSFCGTPVKLALCWDEGLEPALEAVMANGRSAGETWIGIMPGGLCRWVLDPRGKAWGLLCLSGTLSELNREGLDRSVRLLEGMVARAQARLERRGASRGPAAASFVPGLVHELRNAAFGFSAILDAFEARYQDREEAQRYGSALRRNLERLTGFIDELGIYGEPRSGPREPVALDLLLRDAAALCQPLAERLGVPLRADWTGHRVMVRADAEALREAFASLLRWALGQGGGRSVTLTGCGGEGGVAAGGTLDGPGLRMAGLDLARVFEPFYFRAAGMGRLGLPMARRVMEAHGGTLQAVEGAEGEMRIAYTLPGL